VFDSEHFWHLPCTDFSVAKLSDDGHTHRFPDPCCHDAGVIPYQHVNFVSGFCYCCLGWSASVGPVTSVILTALKVMYLVSEVTWHPHHAYFLEVFEFLSDWCLP
jgi:hypothetical protein